MERGKPDTRQVINHCIAFGGIEVNHVEKEDISMNGDQSALNRDSDIRFAGTNTFAKCHPSRLLRHPSWKH